MTTKAKKEKLSFNKFFPESTSFIVLDGFAKGSDDFDVTLKVGDGNNTVTLFTTDWYKDGKTMLKALQDAVNKAVEFQEKALNMAKVDFEERSVFDGLKVSKPKKKAAKK